MEKRSVIFLVHVEELFAGHFPPMLREDIRHVSGQYNKVIVLSSHVEDNGPIWEVSSQHCEEWDWGWGYEPEQFADDELPWVIPANGHEYTWVPEELRDNLEKFRAMNIYVGGGSQYACLQDWLDVLGHVELEYELDYHYIY